MNSDMHAQVLKLSGCICQLHVFFNFFLSVPCMYSYIFKKKIHVCLVVHEYKHELPLLKKNPLHAWSHAADSCLPRLFLFSLHPPAKEVLMGVSHFSSCWLKFTSHLDLHHRPGCTPPLPPPPQSWCHVGALIPPTPEK